MSEPTRTQQAETLLSGLQSHYHTLLAEVEKARTQIEAYTHQKRTIEAAVVDKQDTLKRAEMHLAQCQQRIAQLVHEEQTLMSDVQQRRDRRRRQNEFLRDLATHEGRLSQLHVEIIGLEDRRAALRQGVETLEPMVRERRSRYDQLIREIASLEAQLAARDAAVQERDRAFHERARAEEATRRLHQEVARLRVERQTTTTELGPMRAAKAALESEIESLVAAQRRHRAESATQRKALLETHQRHTALHNEARTLADVIAAARQYQAQRDRLEAERERIGRETKSAQERLDVLVQEVQTLEAQSRTLREEIGQQRRRGLLEARVRERAVAKHKEELAASAPQIAELEAQLHTLRTREIPERDAHIAGLKARIQELETVEMPQRDARSAELEARVQKPPAATEMPQRDEHIVKLDARIQELEKENAVLKADIKKQAAENPPPF